jgi:ent-kaurene oxidase
VTIQRSAVKPYVFKDGLQIPQHTHFSFPNYELNMDADVYEKPEQFDPWRFLKMRRAGDPNKFHFAYVSEHSINFGAGTHACPGRFFVSYEVKLILIYLFTRYDVQWPKGQSRPPNMVHDFSNIPNTMASIMLREKN